MRDQMGLRATSMSLSIFPFEAQESVKVFQMISKKKLLLFLRELLIQRLIQQLIILKNSLIFNWNSNPLMIFFKLNVSLAKINTKPINFIHVEIE